MNTLGKKSEAWVRKYNGSGYSLTDYKSSTKKFTFALEVIHGGIQVARSAGFELVPGVGDEEGSCSVDIDKLATYNDLKNLGHGRATTLGMVLAGGFISTKILGLKVTSSAIGVSNSDAKPFYQHIGYRKDPGLERGGRGGAFLVDVEIIDVAATTAMSKAAAAVAAAAEDSDPQDSDLDSDSGSEDRKEARAEMLEERYV